MESRPTTLHNLAQNFENFIDPLSWISRHEKNVTAEKYKSLRRVQKYDREK